MGKDNMATPAGPATITVEMPVDEAGNPINAAHANMIATGDGRVADMRPITEHDIEIHVPDHIADNYRAICAERHGGDFGALAERFEGDAAAALNAGRPADWRPLAALAAWARRELERGTEAKTEFPHAIQTTDAPATDVKAPAKATTAAKS